MEPIKLGILMWWFTITFFLAQAACAFVNGTLTSRSRTHPQLSFLAHGATWGGLLVLPIVNGLMVSFLDRQMTGTTLLMAAGALIGSMVLHWFWYRTQSITSYLWPKRLGGWYSDLSSAGKMHLWFTAWEAWLIMQYVFLAQAVPTLTVVVIASLLSVFWPLVIIVPCRQITGKWLDVPAAVTTLLTIGATWLVSIAKL